MLTPGSLFLSQRGIHLLLVGVQDRGILVRLGRVLAILLVVVIVWEEARSRNCCSRGRLSGSEVFDV